MSLRVWLPLNGSLENQGLDNITVTNNGATVDNNGKIGKCYSFDGSNYLSIPYSAWSLCGGANPFSICFWVSVNSVSKRNIILGDYGLSGSAAINIEINSSSFSDGSLRFYWNGSPDYKLCAGKFDTANTWYFVAITYDGTTIRSYLNGQLIDIKSQTLIERIRTSGVWRIGADSRTTSPEMMLNGKLNDFRIYDHCLSAKEVKEISKGLILHYQLDGIGTGENLAYKTNEIITATATSTSSAWGACNKYWAGTGYNIPIKNNTVYTLSFDYEFDWTNVSETDHSYIGCGIGTGLGTNGSYTADKWEIQASYLVYGGSTDRGHFVYHCTPKTQSTQMYFAFRLLRYDGANYNGVKIKIWNFKLEEGSVATPWCPNPADDLYKKLGYNNNIEYDCSGFKYNGILPSSMQYTTDTPRYKMSSNFINSTSRISINHADKLLPVMNKTFTINFWLKRDTERTTENGILEFGNLTETDKKLHITIRSSSALAFCFYDDDYLPSYYINQHLNEWIMITCIYTGSTQEVYINGNFLGKRNTKGALNLTGNHAILALYQNYYLKDKLSDFRIYATALSDDDIKELYESAAAIDDKGNLYAYSLEEA